MAYIHGRSCWSNRGRSLDLGLSCNQRVRNLLGSVSPSGDIDRKTNTKYRIGGTMLMFTVGENETVNIWMESCSCLGGYSVNIWIKSVYLLADSRYNKAVKELLSKYAYDSYKSFAEIEARPLSERFVYVGYAEGGLPKDSWGRILFEGSDNAEKAETAHERLNARLSDTQLKALA